MLIRSRPLAVNDLATRRAWLGNDATKFASFDVTAYRAKLRRNANAKKG
jgi:hypothetical protein